jgi:O-antigen ligase
MNVATVETSFIPITQRWSLPLFTVFVLWVLVLFDPHRWIAPDMLGPIPKFIYLALVLMIVVQAPGRAWYPPFLLFLAGGVMASAFAENIGVAQDLVFKNLLLYYILAIGSLTFINSVEKTTLILNLFLLQFLWWSFHGSLAGRVGWHPDLGNEDAFGPLMVMGIGYCYYFARATRNKGLALMGYLLTGLCVVGVVSAFARGAVLAAGALLAYMWLRSSRRGRSFPAFMVAIVVFVLAATLLFPGGQFWDEMSTVSEGFESGTGLDRWILWTTAWREFLENPIFGVGAGNFGIYAYTNLWADNPIFEGQYLQGHLWGRAVHSVYFQVLAEFGLVGTIAFASLLIDFWKRNVQLRSEPFISGWWSATQQGFDLHMLSLALEAAMVGYLVTSVFYDQLYVHWFYSLLAVNVVLHMNAKRVMIHQSPLPV